MEPKYRNIHFSHPSENEECKQLLFHYAEINNRIHHYGNDNHYEKIKKYSVPVEDAVRRLWSSREERYLFYDVLYKGTYHMKMREIDLVNIKSPETIEIAEIKLTSNMNLAIQNGIKQLRISASVLTNKYSRVGCTLIIVDLTSQKKEAGKQIFQDSRIIRKRDGFTFRLIKISIEDLFEYALKRNITMLEPDELQEVIEEAMKNIGRKMQDRIDKISQKISVLINKINTENWVSEISFRPVLISNSIVLSTFYNNQLFGKKIQ